METENKVKVCIKGGMFNGGLNGQHEAYKKAKEESEKTVLNFTKELSFRFGLETPKLVMTSIYDFVNNEMENIKEDLSEDIQDRVKDIIDGVYTRVELAKSLIDILNEQDRINHFVNHLELTEKGILM